MAHTNEEIAAELLYRYVELLRDRAVAGQPGGLSRDELRQLAENLEIASALPAALESAPDLERAATARSRVEDCLAAPIAATHQTPPHRSPALNMDRLRSGGWKLASAWGAAALCAAALLTVNVWHRPRPVVRRIRVPAAAPDVQPLDEAHAHLLIPRMVHDELAPREERDLMWHMLVCPRCFKHYEQLRHDDHGTQAADPWGVRLVHR